MTRSWRDYSPAEIDAGLERQQDRQLARYEAEQDQAREEARPCCGHPDACTDGPCGHEVEVVAVQAATDALTDALLDYDVPTARIVAEFLRLIADPAYRRAA